MYPIAQYPIREEHLSPHIGKSVCGLSVNGDPFYGTIDRVENGHLYLRPLEASNAVVQSIENHLKNQPQVKHAKNKANIGEKLTTSAWGYGYGYGYGYGGLGWGLPLLALGALFLLPFLWW